MMTVRIFVSCVSHERPTCSWTEIPCREGGFITPEAQGFIYDVWVAPDRRGKGVGKFLVEWASDWARQRGYRKIKLEVSETNTRARHVYESLGFRAERRYMGKSLE